MEAHSLTYEPAQSGPRLFSPMRVVALGLVVAAAGLAAWQLREESRVGSVPLLADTILPSSELALMEAAFDRAKLTDYTIDGGRILVPKGRQSSYMRALVDAEALPREFGGSLRRVMETSSPWQSRSAQDERLRIATQEELSLVLCSMPGIRRAAVLYDQEARASLGPGRGLGSGPRQTASVNIETDEDAALDRVRARSIRVLVAASIAGLEPEDVAVTDLRSGLVYAGALEPAMADLNESEASRIALEERLADRIRRSLAYVQGAIVDVRAELGMPQAVATAAPPVPQQAADANAPADVRRSSPPSVSTPAIGLQVSDGRQVVAVHAAVAIPQSSVGSEEEIRQHVLELLPATADPHARTVNVTRFSVTAATAATGQNVAAAKPVLPASAGEPVLAEPAPATVASSEGPRSFPALSFESFSRESLAEVPQQVWLAGLAAVGLTLAGLMWWRSGRSQAAAEPEPLIDWTRHHTPANTSEPTTPPRARAAAMLLAFGLLWGSAGRGDEPPAELPPLTLEPPVLLADADAASTDAESAGETSGLESGLGFEVTAAITMAVAIFGLVALSWFGKKRAASVPRDVFEVLGNGQLDRGHQIAVVRFGPKTLLVSVGSSGCSTLSELDDPQATDAIAHACRHVRVAGQIRGSLRSSAIAASSQPTVRPLESAA
jgi:type III secretory pathway lipoprotein EscJ